MPEYLRTYFSIFKLYRMTERNKVLMAYRTEFTLLCFQFVFYQNLSFFKRMWSHAQDKFLNVSIIQKQALNIYTLLAQC